MMGATGQVLEPFGAWRHSGSGGGGCAPLHKVRGRNVLPVFLRIVAAESSDSQVWVLTEVTWGLAGNSGPFSSEPVLGGGCRGPGQASPPASAKQVARPLSAPASS